MSDVIFIQQARFHCHLGVTPKERAVPQEVLVDVRLDVDSAKAGRSDRIGDTVDYRGVWDAIRECVVPKEYHLVEAVAESIADAVLSSFPQVGGVMVRVTKPGALATRNVEGAGVEIRRTRS